MSYCRWSSDDWKCDLYCYHSVHGSYITHVAGRKHIGVPVNPHKHSIANKEWWLFYQKQMEFLKTAEMKDIGLPYDSMNFSDGSLVSFLERVNCLKEAGYHVPFYVLDTIEEEIEHEAKTDKDSYYL